MTTIQLDEALRGALRTLEDQPLEVPEVPPGWVERAKHALDAEDDLAMEGCASEIVKAHRQYPASWERKAWLVDLRNLSLQSPVQCVTREQAVDRG